MGAFVWILYCVVSELLHITKYKNGTHVKKVYNKTGISTNTSHMIESSLQEREDLFEYLNDYVFHSGM